MLLTDRIDKIQDKLEFDAVNHWGPALARLNELMAPSAIEPAPEVEDKFASLLKRLKN